VVVVVEEEVVVVEEEVVVAAVAVLVLKWLQQNCSPARTTLPPSPMLSVYTGITLL
jgi:hypothetical protein